MDIVGLILVFSAISLFEIPPLIKDKMWRELAVFAGVMVTAMGLTFAQVLGFHIPSPAKGAEIICRPVADWMNSIQ